MNYVGGKFKLLPQILPLFPDNIDTFVDLFAGGFDVGINVEANRIVCNDYQKQIIELYYYLRTNNIEDIYTHIYDRIEQFNLSKTNKEGYLNMRECYNVTRHPLDLYVCICYCYNNQIRFNSKGEFNRAFGMNRSEFNPALQERLRIFVEQLQSKEIRFTSSSFERLNPSGLHENDFVYADPPYLITNPDYSRNDWDETKEKQLYDMLDSINNQGVKFALSNVLQHDNKSNDMLKVWSESYHVHYLNSTYKNANADKKIKNGKTVEVLITNY
jgi:DNA adenine methylase Dam